MESEEGRQNEPKRTHLFEVVPGDFYTLTDVISMGDRCPSMTTISVSVT